MQVFPFQPGLPELLESVRSSLAATSMNLFPVHVFSPGCYMDYVVFFPGQTSVIYSVYGGHTQGK